MLRICVGGLALGLRRAMAAVARCWHKAVQCESEERETFEASGEKKRRSSRRKLRRDSPANTHCHGEEVGTMLTSFPSTSSKMTPFIHLVVERAKNPLLCDVLSAVSACGVLAAFPGLRVFHQPQSVSWWVPT
ncbi:hypothetical protein B0T16DRAFT_402261 [Cercophora newfieldiana]|uniref:Uncharacterized protein n=1 Tax=Cercophora newfieldiana TaxID=92897 RepID=A0AA39YS89_9PEZI|nr:hypothetical protein B0T16DRAFT_402261 [Cercophora newfieldiana]